MRRIARARDGGGHARMERRSPGPAGPPIAVRRDGGFRGRALAPAAMTVSGTSTRAYARSLSFFGGMARFFTHRNNLTSLTEYRVKEATKMPRKWYTV